MLGRGGTDIVPTFVFLPFGKRAKMQVVKTCGGFGADLAAADGWEELAVKGNRHLFEFERESGNGGGKDDFATAGGKNVLAIEDAVRQALEFAKTKLEK